MTQTEVTKYIQLLRSSDRETRQLGYDLLSSEYETKLHFYRDSTGKVTIMPIGRYCYLPQFLNWAVSGELSIYGFSTVAKALLHCKPKKHDSI